jgi:hypothetical protein
MIRAPFKGTISINRRSDDKISVSFVDDASRTEFLDVQLSMSEMMSALTGLAYVPVKGEVRGLDVVGKERVREKRSITYPGRSSDRSVMQKWLTENAQEEGWTVDSYLGSQSSISYKDGETILNYAVFKFV